MPKTAPKKLMYVPGLARPELVFAQANSAQAFIAKVGRAFRGDAYMTDMVDTIHGKGAVPVDCRQTLRWVEIPKAPAPTTPTHRRSAPITEALPKAPHKPGIGKALKVLGPTGSNVLSLSPGTAPVPMKMSVGTVLTPCSAPEFMAQPLPSSAKTKALAGVAAGDTLYIIGHSNALGGSLTYKCPAPGHDTDTCQAFTHSEKRHIDPVTLGSLLINEGLPTGIKFDIALVACFSGGLEDADLQTVQSFAQRLAGTLNPRGYQCRVYGATGLTSSDKGQVYSASSTAQQADGLIMLNSRAKTKLEDEDGQPFYRRFFRFFG